MRTLMMLVPALVAACSTVPDAEDTISTGGFAHDDKADAILHYDITLAIDRTAYALTPTIEGEVAIEVTDDRELTASGTAVAFRPAAGQPFSASITDAQRVFFMLYRVPGKTAWRLLEPPVNGEPKRAFQTFTKLEYRPGSHELYGEWTITDLVRPLSWTWNVDGESWIPIGDGAQLEWATFVLPWSSSIGSLNGSYDYDQLKITCAGAACVPPAT